MHKSDRLALKTFADQLEAQLELLSCERSKDLVRRLARDLAPEERPAFLAQLVPERMPAAILTLTKPESLVPDVLALKKRYATDMTGPGHHYRARRDDNRKFQGDYGKYGPELESLFERARAVFDLEEFGLALNAYRELFEILALKDDYGFGVHRPAGIDLRAERGRYLRAVIESTAPQAKAGILLETARKLQQDLWDAADLSLTEPFQVKPLESEEKAEVLDDLFKLLSEDVDRQSDRWLREVTRLRHGARGLEELARTHGERRPRAWIDWLEMVAAENDPARLLTAAKDALAGIADGLNLRAVAADHLVRAAGALGDHQTAMLGRWEAFRAEPWPRRLMDLWEGAVSLLDRQEWMLRAVAYGERGAEALLPGPFVGGTGREEDAPFLEPGDGFYDAASPAITICARLLAGDWQATLADAKSKSPGEWRCGDAGFQIVLSLLMAWFTGWPSRELPRSLADLLNQTLALFDEQEEKTPRTSVRLRDAFADVVSAWKPSTAPESQVEALAALALREVKDLIAAGKGAADRLATLLAAAISDLRHARGSRDADPVILIQERNCHIIEMRHKGVERTEIARRFNLTPTRVAQLEKRARVEQHMAERRARLRAEIRAADDLDMLWPVDDLADSIGLVLVTKKRLQAHFAEVSKEQVSLRELMDMCLEGPLDRWGLKMPPLLNIKGIGKKGFWSVVNGLTNLGLGGRCEEEWQSRLAKVKKWARTP